MTAGTASPLLSGNTWSRVREKQVKVTTGQCAKEMHRLLWEHVGRGPELPRFGNRVRRVILEERHLCLVVPKTSEGAGRGSLTHRHRALPQSQVLLWHLAHTIPDSIRALVTFLVGAGMPRLGSSLGHTGIGSGDWNQVSWLYGACSLAQTSLAPKNEKGTPVPLPGFPQCQPRTSFCTSSWPCPLLFSSMVRSSCETELNPNVLTSVGSGSKEHSQVTKKPELCLPNVGGGGHADW